MSVSGMRRTYKGLPVPQIATGQPGGADVRSLTKRLDAFAYDQWAQDHDTTHGLTYGHKGGTILAGGVYSRVNDSTTALADNATNYVERDGTTGAVTANVVGFTAGKTPMAVVMTKNGQIDDHADWRPQSTAPASGGALGGSGTAGKIAKWSGGVFPSITLADSIMSEAAGVVTITGGVIVTTTVSVPVNAIAWTMVSKSGSSLADLATRSASDLSTGTLALGRGGSGADLSATGGAGQYIKQAGVGAAFTVGTIPASDIASGVALTRVNDTNVTLTLGGASATALLAAASLTLGWTGTLADGRIASAATWNAKQDHFTILSTLGALADSVGWLHNDGAGTLAWSTPPGGVTSVSGTANRIAVSPTTGAVIVNIDPAYVGQVSITTLGTIATGVWNGTIIDISHGGTGSATLAGAGIVTASLTTGTLPVASAATVLADSWLSQVGAALTLVTGKTFTADANAIAWALVNKTGSSLADLATRSAGDLSSGNLPYAQLPTGGGTWANSGALAITGGAVTIERDENSATSTTFQIQNLDTTTATLHASRMIWLLARTADATARNAGLIQVNKSEEWTSAGSTNNAAMTIQLALSGALNNFFVLRASPTAQQAYTRIFSASSALAPELGGANVTADNTIKRFRIGVLHYNNSVAIPTAMLSGVSDSAAATLNIGGGATVMNAVTLGQIYAAATTTTATGTLVVQWDVNALFPGATATFSLGKSGTAWTTGYMASVDSGSATDLLLARNGVTQLTLSSLTATFAGALVVTSGFGCNGAAAQAAFASGGAVAAYAGTPTLGGFGFASAAEFNAFVAAANAHRALSNNERTALVNNGVMN